MSIENKEVSKPTKKFGVMQYFLIIIGVICIGVAGYGLFDIFSDYNTAVETYDELEEEFVQEFIPSKDSNSGNNGTEVNSEVQVPWYQLVSVNLKGIQKKYPEVVGWIYFENEKLSYPVMQTTDNEKYLTLTYDGKTTNSGSIFMETTHSSDFSDTHTIIYGHNMKNLSMFGKLKFYRTKSGYYDNHQYFQIFSGNQILRYRVFAYEEVGVDSFVYQQSFQSAKELGNKLIEGSMVNAGITINDGDKIITLSTCTADDEHRFIVCGVLVETYTIE